ncbi:tetratricopeptide repeat protein [Salinarimonas ramus]|uniref:Tetratricopeptide repeat protein n=1 Tax=Salinarimonas ramus TaxID=690164 RepID=A0A917QCV2_9HYPH|nr:tetratricopeptide repeat protein [Salinarimonas ramus]GGK41657.1 hypothetical protein GCM10011322_30980 [Salinarimonas ramus]
MRRFRLALIATTLLLGSLAAALPLGAGVRAQEASTNADTRVAELYDRLAATESASEARGIALLIQRRWLESGSPTADLLMERARQAMRGRDPALAIELIDRILVIEPGWAEAWNRRAIAFTMLDDPVAAIADIYRVVSLEPRHFAAWAGLGNLLMRAGDERGALESFERALAIHPHLPRIDAIVAKLSREVDGVDL